MMNKIKDILKNKKIVTVTVLVLLAVSISVGYILTNKKEDVKPNVDKTSEVKENKNTKKGEIKDTKKDSTKETKKEDKKEVKEDKKSETNETKTTDVPENTTSNNATNVTETQNHKVSNNSYSNTSSNSQPASTPCVPTYTTVNHPEQGHYETQVIRDAWDEPVYEERIVGGHTGRIYNSLDEWGAQEEDGNYSVKMVQVDTIHHDAETQQVWVVDQQAWTETVASGC